MVTVTPIDQGIHCIDLDFLGRPGIIAAYLIEDAGERALIETGPTSTLDTLLAGLERVGIPPETIAKVMVTHVHLDHAGAAGTFLRRFPQAQLFVHEVGLPHTIDPSKLVSSATRIYGDMMDLLWGEVEPVPETRATALTDGDTIAVGDTQLSVLYTPGHASHHVAYQDAARGVIFTGDVAAVRLQGFDHVRPPTPPPDINLELWSQSLERLGSLNPRVLCLTHFGPFTDVEWHLRQARDRLYEWAEIVRQGVERGADKPEIAGAIRQQDNPQLLRLTADPSALDRYDYAASIDISVDGLLRYVTKRAQAAGRSAQ